MESQRKTTTCKIPKPVYLLLYIGGDVITCLIERTGCLGDTRWISKEGGWEGTSLMTRKMAEVPKRKDLTEFQPEYIIHR